MPGKYAERTDVTAVQSLADIQHLIERYGCESFAFGRDGNRVQVTFEMHQRRVRFTLPLPEPTDKEFEITRGNQFRRVGTGEYSKSKYEQAVRQRYRALLLTIKAKLESVESQIETFEEAFLAQLVMPSGATMGQWAKPQIEQMYLTGNMPKLLPDTVPSPQ